MDDQEFSGSASEFLSMRGDDGDDPTIPSPAAADDAALAAPDDATDDPAAEDDDLSPEERVAAVLAEDAEPPSAPEDEALEADDADNAEPDDPSDLSQYTPEQLRELAEEALRLRAEMAETNGDAEQQQLLSEVSALDQQAVQRVQQRYEREVISTSERHYGALLTQAHVQLYLEAQDQRDPEQYFAANLERVRAPILRAQRAWEAKQAAAWEPAIEQEIAASRKQHPGLRRRYAEFLVEERGLPKRAVDELLKVSNTDDMPVVADSLKASVAAHRKTKTQSNQALREQAAKNVHPIHSPATGRPAARKPVELKGEAEEWLEMRRQFAR